MKWEDIHDILIRLKTKTKNNLQQTANSSCRWVQKDQLHAIRDFSLRYIIFKVVN